MTETASNGHGLDVQLRPYALDDAQALYEAAREALAELQPWAPWAHQAYSIEESRSWLQRQVRAFQEGTEFEFAIVSAEGRYLGGCGLNQIDRAKRQANLGYWVRTSATRSGVATRAVRLIRDRAFEHTDLVRLEIVVAVGNTASRRVAEKSGATPEGLSKNRLFLFGVAHDAAVFSFTRRA